MKLISSPRRGNRLVQLQTSLPGPDRKRCASEYRFRLTYRNHRTDEAGCVSVWEVVGGRLPYQIAVERVGAGSLVWHCSCADAVYRGDDGAHRCKHVAGLLECLDTLAESARAA
jgi:hypothetical protein